MESCFGFAHRSMSIRARWLAAGGILVVSMVGCSHGSTRSAACPRTMPAVARLSPEQQRLAEAVVKNWRRRWSQGPGLMRIKMTVRRGTLSMSSRGLLAVEPNQAARLVVLGPGGATAFDLWLTKDSYRLAVPARNVRLRGRGEPRLEPGASFPVAMLRWWFLTPLQGPVLATEECSNQGISEPRVWLGGIGADPGRYLVWQDATSGAFSVVRVVGDKRESLSVDEPGCSQAVWRNESKHWYVSIQCEQWQAGAAVERALRDPDGKDD